MRTPSKIAVGLLSAACLTAGGIAFASESQPSQTPDQLLRPPDRGSLPAVAAHVIGGLSRPDVAAVDPAYRLRLENFVHSRNPDADASTLRLLHREKGIDVYAAAGTQTLCWVSRDTITHGATSFSCGMATDDSGQVVPHADSAFDGDDGYLVTALMPEGFRTATLQFTDGSAEQLAVDNNVAAYHGLRRPQRLDWTAPDGRTGSLDVSLQGSTAGNS